MIQQPHSLFSTRLGFPSASLLDLRSFVPRRPRLSFPSPPMSSLLLPIHPLPLYQSPAEVTETRGVRRYLLKRLAQWFLFRCLSRSSAVHSRVNIGIE